MAKTHHRVFALVVAILFLATSLATGVAVVWQINNDNQNQAQPQVNESNESEKLLEAMKNCNINEPVPASKEEVPKPYVPNGAVEELQKTDIKLGNGKEAKDGDCLVVKYIGTLAKNGKKFDGNFSEESALQFSLGIGSVIPGWDKGLVGMKEGECDV